METAVTESRRYLVTASNNGADYRRTYYRTYKGARMEAHRILSAARTVQRKRPGSHLKPTVTISYSDENPKLGHRPNWQVMDRLVWDDTNFCAVPSDEA